MGTHPIFESDFDCLTEEKTARAGIVKRAMSLHVKCRGDLYANTSVSRPHVANEFVPFAVKCPDYHPTEFTNSFVFGAAWADDEETKKITFNRIDGEVDRTSFTGIYDVVDGRPRNPRGRTGITGRGNLGKWGPNHAADPIVTTWKRKDGEKVIHPATGKPILRFVSIFRKKDSEWAIPGGMVDPGENISQTLKREFAEEALDSNNHPERKRTVEKLFKCGIKIYEGYVDDPRNTDNAWMETQAYNYHDELGSLSWLALTAGDDASDVKWSDISADLKLYASHSDFVRRVAQLHEAHW